VLKTKTRAASVKRHSQLIQGDGKSEKRGTNPLSAILSSLAGEDTHATAHANLKSKHPDIFRQDGLQLRGFDSIWKKAKRVPPCFVGRETIDGFYYRLPLGINPKEQPKFKSIFNNLQNIQFEGDIWYKKDDWHFVARSTTIFPKSDGNWGFVQLDPQTNELSAFGKFVSQQDAEPAKIPLQLPGILDADGDTLLAQLESINPLSFNPLSLGVHPPRTTLVLTYHDTWDFWGSLAVTEEIIKLQ